MFGMFKRRELKIEDDGTPEIDVTFGFDDHVHIAVLRDEQCVWMADPDEYGELPLIAPGTVLSSDAQKEYDRKKFLRIEATREIDRQLAEENVLYGWEKNPEQREVLVQQYARMLQSADDAAFYEGSLEHAAEEREQRRHEELLNTIESSTAFGAAKKFQREHPFLAGFIGADVVHKITKE